MLYSGKRTTYPAKGCCIQEKEQPIQLKVDVSRERSNNKSKNINVFS